MQSPRQRYPFRLGTTSFIYPAGYAANVEKLAPLVDEIELLFFESAPRSWPSDEEIRRLIELAQRHYITYNIHLPLDVVLGDPRRAKREGGVNCLVGLLEHIDGLSATSFTLHLEYPTGERGLTNVSTWQALTASSLSDLLKRTLLPPPLFAVETLNYPPEWFAPLVESLNLSVCLDVGHLLLHDLSLVDTINRFRERIAIVHLHGIDAGRDHRSVAHLPPSVWATLRPFLDKFRGSVSLELFSLELFQESMTALRVMMAGDANIKV